MGNKSFCFRRTFLLVLPRLSSEHGDGSRLSTVCVQGGLSLPTRMSKQAGPKTNACLRARIARKTQSSVLVVWCLKNQIMLLS